MIQGITGLPGSGKTYFLARLGLAEIKKGRDVYANFKLDGAKPYTDLKQVFELRNGLILIDEINLLCPSRWWDRFPPQLAYHWSQTRKSQLDVWWSSQHIDRVDKIVREISNWVWIVKHLPFGICLMTCYLPEQINKMKRESFNWKLFHINKGVFKRYNTYERIEVPSWVRG